VKQAYQLCAVHTVQEHGVRTHISSVMGNLEQKYVTSLGSVRISFRLPRFLPSFHLSITHCFGALDLKRFSPDEHVNM
jgi:hypothetical protein